MYTTTLPCAIPEALREEFSKRLAYVSEGLVEPRLEDCQRLTYQLRNGFEHQASTISAHICDVAEKLCANPEPAAKTIASRAKFPTPYAQDPHISLLAQGDLFAFGRGRYGFGPRMTALVHSFDARIQQAAGQCGAGARTFPSLIGAGALDRCRYLKNFPSSLNLVSHLREDHRVLQDFVSSVQWDGSGLDFASGSASPVECLLAPSVCFHWYEWLRESRLDQPSLITALGKCFRYESSNLTGLERLWDFTMRELVFVGPETYVLSQRDKMVQVAVQLLEEWGLAYEITTASDPFFIDNYAIQAAYQQGYELKYELLVPLPYSGKKLAVGSINYHQDFFGRCFSIEAEGGPAHTGCIGFGLERLALAFLAQHGHFLAT